MKSRFVYYGCFVFLVPSLLSACNTDTTFPKQAAQASPEEHKLPNGLRVEILPAEKSDVARVLGVKMWKFKVTRPKAGQLLNCQLLVRRKGKAIATLGGVGTAEVTASQNPSIDVLIGLHPLKDSWSESDEVKSLIGTGSGGSPSVHKNPFKDLSIGYGDATLQKDGSFLLMVGDKQSTKWPQEKDNDLALVLVLKVEKVNFPHQKPRS